MRREPRCPRSPSCCREAKRRRSFRSRDAAIGSPSMPCAGKTSSGRLSRNSRRRARVPCWCSPSRKCWHELRAVIMRVLDWSSLSDLERQAALRRPAQRDAAAVRAEARDIIDSVRRDGDAAVRALPQRFDGVSCESLEVTPQEFLQAERDLDGRQHAAIDTALSTVRMFHAAQLPAPLRVETAPGVVCERISVPVRAVGLYVPAGVAPLPSTAIMLAVPAAIAGCPLRVMCTAPSRGGIANPAVLTVARKAGVERVFKVGGAQAIAAMAYGTATIPKCD